MIRCIRSVPIYIYELTLSCEDCKCKDFSLLEIWRRIFRLPIVVLLKYIKYVTWKTQFYDPLLISLGSLHQMFLYKWFLNFRCVQFSFYYNENERARNMATFLQAINIQSLAPCPNSEIWDLSRDVSNTYLPTLTLTNFQITHLPHLLVKMKDWL